MNILTFDVEEWFHLLDYDATRTENEWKNYEVRIHENVERIFSILEDTNTKATFFIIGWIAKTYPDLVRKIAEKYQIGSPYYSGFAAQPCRFVLEGCRRTQGRRCFWNGLGFSLRKP